MEVQSDQRLEILLVFLSYLPPLNLTGAIPWTSTPSSLAPHLLTGQESPEPSIRRKQTE